MGHVDVEPHHPKIYRRPFCLLPLHVLTPRNGSSKSVSHIDTDLRHPKIVLPDITSWLRCKISTASQALRSKQRGQDWWHRGRGSEDNKEPVVDQGWAVSKCPGLGRDPSADSCRPSDGAYSVSSWCHYLQLMIVDWSDPTIPLATSPWNLLTV